MPPDRFAMLAAYYGAIGFGIIVVWFCAARIAEKRRARERRRD